MRVEHIAQTSSLQASPAPSPQSQPARRSATPRPWLSILRPWPWLRLNWFLSLKPFWERAMSLCNTTRTSQVYMVCPTQASQVLRGHLRCQVLGILLRLVLLQRASFTAYRPVAEQLVFTLPLCSSTVTPGLPRNNTDNQSLGLPGVPKQLSPVPWPGKRLGQQELHSKPACSAVSSQ